MRAEYITAAVPIQKAGSIPVNTAMRCHASNCDSCAGRSVSYIVLHYTGNRSDTAWANARYFAGANRRASAHYFVDEAAVYQSVPAKDRAWHCGDKHPRHPYCRNANSIGIEMCTSGDYRVSARTIANAAELTAAWCRLLGIGPDEVDKYVLRHYDVTGKACPAQMAGAGNEAWRAFLVSVKAALGGGAATTTTATAPVVTATAGAVQTKGEVCSVELPVLRKGMKSGYVKTLQILLNKYDRAGLTEDGDFGAATDKAVRSYQRSRSIGVDGLVGAKTWGCLLR